jgi:hypothetical protein
VESWRSEQVDPILQPEKQPEYDTAPQQMAPEEEPEVHEEAGAQEALARFRWKDCLERTKDKNQHDECKSGSGEQVEHADADRVGVSNQGVR